MATTQIVAFDPMAILAEKIRNKRKEKGFSQVRLAELAGVSQQLITKLERGEARESRKLPRIAAALGVTVEELVSDTELSEPQPKKEEQWPFELTYDRFARLPERERIKIEGVVENMVRDMERSLAGAEFKSAKRKRRRAG